MVLVPIGAAVLPTGIGVVPLGAVTLLGKLAKNGRMTGLVDLGGQVGLVSYRVQWEAMVVERPTCRSLPCCLAAY